MHGLANDFHHRVDFRQNVMVPEAKDLKSLGFQPGGAAGVIVFLVAMLPTISLDHERQILTEEVRNERADRDLPSELGAVELATAQPRPQPGFGRCLLAAQSSGPLSVRMAHGVRVSVRVAVLV
jgi:hypothetical protein